MKRLFTVDDKYHGHGRVTFVWHRNHLACAGGNGLVHVFNRQGEQIDEIALVKQGRVIIDWDHEGEHLAVLQEGGDSVTIWNLSSRWVKTVDLGFKDPSFMRWSRQGSELAIGTCSGNLLLYNLDSRKKIPVIGKHTSIILCGDWSNKNNVLALGSDDKSMTFSSASGETLSQTRFAVGPTSVQFAQPLEKSTSSPLDDDWGTKTGGSTVAKSDRISVNLGKRKIQIYEDTDMKAEPITIDFPDKYGKIKRYIWFEEGYLVVGFAKGTMLVLSVQDEFLEAKTGSPKSKRYKKLCSFPLFDEHLREMKYCANLRKLACVGDDCVKIVEYTGSGSWQVNKSETIRLEGSPSITSVAWTQDGQILSIGTSKGCVHNFVATMPLLYDRFGSSMVHMTSLREASIRSRPGGKSRKITLEMEPAFVALGARHFAAGMNSRVWFYASSNEDDDGEDDDSKTRDDLDDEDVWSPCGEKEYLSSVELVRLGHGCAAVLCGDGRVYLHSLDGEESAVFPEHQNDVVTCVALTSQLLIYGTRDGHLRYFSLQDWASLNGCEIRHTSGIQRIFPNQEGTRVIFVDDHGSGFMHSASGSSTVLISEIGNASGSIRVRDILWDWNDWGIFTVVSDSEIVTFAVEPLNINGPQINVLGKMQVDMSTGEVTVEPISTPCPSGFRSIMVHDGVMYGQMKSGNLKEFVLATHDAIHSVNSPSRELSRDVFCQNLVLGRFDDAWKVAERLDSRAYWLALSTRAMELVNVPNAIRAYRRLGDAGMVMALERLSRLEDKNLLAGHICVLFSDFSQAQELFLRSSNARAALDMRKDLLHWDHAIKLAKTLAPEEVPSISIKYAQQLERRGETASALGMFKSANDNSDDLNQEEKSHIRAGIARTTVRMGDIRQGRKLALESRDNVLCCECASIMENMKQYDDAALLFERGHEFEKAASIYIATKNFSKAAPLMEKISSTKLHAQFAKAKRAQKDYIAAAEAYERAHDMDSVVEIYLNHLGQPERAMEIVRGTHSARAAQMVATHCNTTGNYAGAIEFLLMAKRQSEAFELAKTYDGMDMYAEKLGKNGKAENYIQIAKYFENKKDWGRAAHFYAICCQYHKALKFYLHCGETYIDKAIALVGEAQSDMLTHTLIDFLSGDTDGVPKDNNYVYRLYMALGKYAQAAKTAVIISKQEQDLGNYRYARQVLYQTQRELMQMNMKVPKNLRQAFSLIHSYLLVKGLAKSGDHLNAARMLIRVANNISKFPAHDVSILTSCVIECQRAGLKAMAFKYASKLIMVPEFREKIPPKFKRKIEQIVRKFRHCKDDVTECETTPSPYAPQREVPVVDLVCPITKNDLPWCVVSGYHMNLSDWCVCPNSKLPALYSKYKEFIQRGGSVDPVLGKPIRASDLILVEDPKSLLKSFDGSDSSSSSSSSSDSEKGKKSGNSDESEDTKKTGPGGKNTNDWTKGKLKSGSEEKLLIKERRGSRSEDDTKRGR